MSGSALSAGDAATDAHMQPLAKVRVLDVSQVMAGPYTCMLLGDLGADVIKIEPPGRGDQTRGAMGFKLKGNDSLGFINMNRNKRSVAINLKQKAGRDIFLSLAKSADVIVENYRPGVMRRLGCDYSSVKEINPGIIYASISGFGQRGPWAERPGFDLMAQAMSGIMSVTGHPGEKPAKAGVPVSDIGCGLFATYAILAALIGRSKTGQGQYIDASLFDAALAFSVWEASEYWGTGKVPDPLGTANRMSAPYQAVRSQDGYFVMGATSQRLWERLCDALQLPELKTDPRFLTIADRLKNREVLIAALEQVFEKKPSQYWVDELLAIGIPSGPVYNYKEAFESEHSSARHMRMSIKHPIEGETPVIGFPVKMGAGSQRVRRHAPLLGEHTNEVLAECGFSADEIDRFAQEGVFKQ